MRGPSCELALNIKSSNFEDVTSCTHPLISDIIFLYQLAQAHPHNVLHFLVIIIGGEPDVHGVAWHAK